MIGFLRGLAKNTHFIPKAILFLIGMFALFIGLWQITLICFAIDVLLGLPD